MKLVVRLAIGDDEFEVEGVFDTGDTVDTAEFEPTICWRIGGGLVRVGELARLYAPRARTSWCAVDALRDKLLDLAEAECQRRAPDAVSG